MTKPEGYEGHYADASTERDAEDKKIRKEFEAYFRQPPYEWTFERFTDTQAWPGNYRNFSCECAWDAWQAACASKQKEIEQYKLIGYIEPTAPIEPRWTQYIYIVGEEGFDGCTVPVFIKGE